MSKGLQPSGRLVTAIFMERLQFERERSVPWMFTASDGKEYEQPPVEPINFGKMCERIAEIKYVGGPFLRDWIERVLGNPGKREKRADDAPNHLPQLEKPHSKSRELPGTELGTTFP